MSKLRLAALDLDGTLVDSAPDLTNCLGDALAELGFPKPDLPQTRSWIGDGVEVLIERGLKAALDSDPDPELISRTLARFDHFYQRKLFTDSKVYSGVPETLEALKDAGLILGCITNKREGYARRMLELAGLSACLSFIYGGDTFSRRKPDPEPLLRACEAYASAPEQAVMIGDSSNDRDAAAAAGFQFVFAAYGYGSDSVIDGTDQRRTISEFAQLRELLCAATGHK